MTACGHCGRELETRFRFCPWCGTAQRRKLVEFFRPHPNSAGRALRVSRYYGDDPQVRFSVWDDGIARAAVSLDEEEAHRLARFVQMPDSAKAVSVTASRSLTPVRRLRGRIRMTLVERAR